MQAPETLRGLVERYLDELALTPELGELAKPMRYGLVGGKRIRGTICLAVGEAVGAQAESLLPAAASLELVQAFSLVHDDLPGLDDDAERRGRPSTWAAHGVGVAILAGDGLLAEAFRLALSYPTPAVARELASATLGMIGGQFRDIRLADAGDEDRDALNRLKTGALFTASVCCALWAAEVPEREHAAWRAFAEELGPLFQIVDDVLDGDGYVLSHGEEAARALAEDAAARARQRLADVQADTSVLAEIVDGLAARTA
jgi:geranylgeranyl diphosphate synthase, type II